MPLQSLRLKFALQINNRAHFYIIFENNHPSIKNPINQGYQFQPLQLEQNSNGAVLSKSSENRHDISFFDDSFFDEKLLLMTNI